MVGAKEEDKGSQCQEAFEFSLALQISRIISKKMTSLLPRGAIYSPSLVSLLHMQRSHLKPFSEVLMSQTQSFLSNIQFIIAAVINGSYLCFA